MIEERAELSACVTVEVMGSSPASIPGRSNTRIGRVIFVRASGLHGSEILGRFMGFDRSPNKTPEPTTGTVTPRAIADSASLACVAGTRVAPVPVVAHL